MSLSEYDKRKRLIQKHEGLRLYPYVDSHLSKLTIGYGHNLNDRGITHKQAEALLNDDLVDTESHLWKKIPGILEDLSYLRRAVLIDMAFCLGVVGLLKFKNMLRALKAEDYTLAAEEILNSEFAAQTKMRARRLAKMMKTNEWPNDVDLSDDA